MHIDLTNTKEMGLTDKQIFSHSTHINPNICIVTRLT